MNLGQIRDDAQTPVAEIAAVGLGGGDTHYIPADGGSYSRNLGHGRSDAQSTCAEITPSATLRLTPEVTLPTAPYQQHLGPAGRDAQRASAEIAAAGHILDDTRFVVADGGTFSGAAR